jgi:hypothetical protein
MNITVLRDGTSFRLAKYNVVGENCCLHFQRTRFFLIVAMKTSSYCKMLVATTRLQKAIPKWALNICFTVTRILGLTAQQTANCTINATLCWFNLHHTIPTK